MNVRRKRPIGITLLAIEFLWIGCGGTLIFPIMALTGTLGTLGELLLGQIIHSDRLLHLLSVALATIWFGAYVLYAFIGFGLWKLRSWAWKAVVIVHWICIGGGVLGGLITALHNLAMGIAVLGILAPYGGILWYLYRPGVKATFGLFDNSGTTGIPPPPKPTSKPTVACVVGLCVLGVAVFVGGLCIYIEKVIRSSDIYKMAFNRAQTSPCVVHRLGTPVTSGFGTTGELSESSDDGSADLEIPLRGPKGKATLQLSASKQEGRWTLKTLALADGPDLLTGPCSPQ